MIKRFEQYAAVVHMILRWSGKHTQAPFYSTNIAQELAEDVQYRDGLVCWVEYLTPEVR